MAGYHDHTHMAYPSGGKALARVRAMQRVYPGLNSSYNNENPTRRITWLWPTESVAVAPPEPVSLLARIRRFLRWGGA